MASFHPRRSLLHSASLCAVAVANLRGSTDHFPASGSDADVNASSLGQNNDCCYTDVTVDLQNLMDSDRGVIVRNPLDEGVVSESKPASLWLNSIYPPNQLYIWSEDTTGQGQGEFQCYKAHLAVVVDDSKMDWLLRVGDDRTFYAHDANSCDDSDANFGRCYWDGDFGPEQRWNCPGVYKEWDGVSWTDTKSTDAGGSGWFKCRGCHFDQSKLDFDQDIDGDVTDDWNCNCPSNIGGEEYAERIFNHGYMADQGWDMDKNACWDNDPNAMADKQNHLWWKWMQEKGVRSEDTKDNYWGWNEVAVDSSIDDPSNWKALLVFLPAASELGLTQISMDEQKDFHDRLVGYWTKNPPLLQTGVAAMGERPGSYIVMAKEEDDGTQSGNFKKQFFCESWKMPGSQLQICFKQQDEEYQGHPGYCYVEESKYDCQ